VSIILLTTGQQCQWYRWPMMGGVNDTADQGGRSVIFLLEPDPHSGAGFDLNVTLSYSDIANQWWAVSMMPLTLAGWWQGHCDFNYANFVWKLSGVNDTADQWWVVTMIPLTRRPQSLACSGCFKGNSYSINMLRKETEYFSIMVVANRIPMILAPLYISQQRVDEALCDITSNR
jgi:hypothetical protein